MAQCQRHWADVVQMFCAYWLDFPDFPKSHESQKEGYIAGM